MKHVLAVIVLSLAMLPNVVGAGPWFSKNLTPSNFGVIEVNTIDDATGGCWTNLGEAKTYAEDKLRNRGFQIVEQVYGRLDISVTSERERSGGCYGAINIEINLWVEKNQMGGILVLGFDSLIFVNQQNANTLVLNQIKSFIEAMTDQ